MKKLKPALLSLLTVILIVAVIFLIKNNQYKNYNKSQLNETNTDQSTVTPTKEVPKIYWSLDAFVDDFGDPLKEKFIETKTEGVFTNSATVNSFLGIKILFTKRNIGLFMHEYNYNRPAEYFIGDGTISMKNTAGEIVNGYTGSKWNNTGGISLRGNTYTKIKNFLIKSSGEIRVHVQDEYSSTYDFTINADGFAEAFKHL